ncbi:MAG: hypothetical protein IJZ84_05485 [Lachnospiraceae bacterium]|nr:hypothetical protein [Lachnospiraceae bacterium]
MFKNKKNLSIIFSIATALAGTYGISYLSSFTSGTQLTYSVFSIGLFAALALLLQRTFEDIVLLTDRRSKVFRISFAFLTAFVFALTLVLGYQLKGLGMTEGGLRGKGLIFLRSFLLAFTILPFSNLLYKWAESIRSFVVDRTATSKDTAKPWSATKLFFIVCGIIFLCWIPVFLAYYPAVMSFDFHRQSQEAARGFIWFNSYQPLAHTWLIWVAFQIGNAFGSLQTGMAFYSFFQMLILAVSLSYSCSVVYRLVKRKWAIVLLTAFYAFFPYISILSVTVTKDVIFSALFLVFVCLFIERTFFAEGKKQLVLDILWIIEGIVMVLFRNNALYAAALFIMIWFFMGEKKQRLRILALGLCLMIGGKGALEGMHIILGTEIRGSQVEMFSVPIQQFGRVGDLHGDTLDEETRALIDTYVPEHIWDEYYPPISDTLKGTVGQFTFDETWKGHYGDMLKAWIQVGLQYPNEYIDAFLELTAGYWSFDDVSWAEVLGYGLEERMGALYTYNSTVSDVLPEGIAHETKFPWLENVLENIVSANAFYKWPVFSNLFKPALYCWGLILILVLCFYNYNKKKILVTLYPLAYFATLLLGPVVQVRYVLPLIVTVPVLLAMFVYNERKESM